MKKPDCWNKMDKFDREWYTRSQDGTLLESEREKVQWAACDHQNCGNYDVSEVLMSLQYRKE